MVARTTTIEQVRVAMQSIEPLLGRYSSAWCRRLLYSTMHHTSGSFDQRTLVSKNLGFLFDMEPWPARNRHDIYDTEHMHWCEECLKYGYHFFGHQLVGLAKCPLHNTPMRSDCPNCGYVLPMRSRLTRGGCAKPLRNCIYCNQPIFNLASSFRWIKTADFLQFEHEALRRFAHWAHRVDRLYYRVYQHTEGACLKAAEQMPSKEQTRLAIEEICSLPCGIVTESRLSGLVAMVVVLDAHLVKGATVSTQDQAMLGEMMLRHLGNMPLPVRWVRHWRTLEIETPMPSNAGESSHFDCWREQLVTTCNEFKPAGPDEWLLPCMLPLLAARLVAQFNDLAKGGSHFGGGNLAASFFFSSENFVLLNAPLGAIPGIIVELHSGCDYEAYRSGGEASEVES